MPELTLFHLLTHALFKALLFVCAGTLIHLHTHGQDLRTVRNIAHQIPLTTRAITVARLALCGAPFLAGFYSKDIILEAALSAPTNLVATRLMMTATALTARYSIRLALAVIWRGPTSGPLSYTHDEDSNLPIIALGRGAIVGGGALN